MSHSLAVRTATDQASPCKKHRAAQYVRMSTEHQRYSTENQAATIGAYAAQHGLTIVRTYADKGISGLRMSNRAGLVELLNDVRFGEADFEFILVYDVSRWGRFQDVDESAHYEFVCREAGIKLIYCAEQFDNDGSLISNIVKNLKRVMAAEYSRELSVKVHAGACRVAGLGFRSGAMPGYGLRRELVDENGNSKGLLSKGQRKHLQTDRVLLRPGPEDELRIVRQIFRMFAVEKRSQSEIARHLNNKGVPNHLGRPWSEWIIHYLLQNENYIGIILYNRQSFRLRQVKTINPPESWIRGISGFKPIISPALFEKAQCRMREHYTRWSDAELLQRLKAVLDGQKKLSAALISREKSVPSPSLYAWRFGSLRNAFRLVDYVDKRNYHYLDSKRLLVKKLIDRGAEVAAKIRALGAPALFNERAQSIRVADCLTVSLRIARHYHQPGKRPIWHVTRQAKLPSGLVLALRLDYTNTDISDYFLFPTEAMHGKRLVALTETDRSRLSVYRSSRIEDVVRGIMEVVAAGGPPSPATREPKRARNLHQLRRRVGGHLQL